MAVGPRVRGLVVVESLRAGDRARLVVAAAASEMPTMTKCMESPKFRQVARHAFFNVTPSDHGEHGRCPRVATGLYKAAARLVMEPSADSVIWLCGGPAFRAMKFVNFDINCRHFAHKRRQVRRLCRQTKGPTSGQGCPPHTPNEVFASMPKIGNPETLTSSVQDRSNSAGICRVRANFGQCRARAAPHRPNLAES